MKVAFCRSQQHDKQSMAKQIMAIRRHTRIDAWFFEEGSGTAKERPQIDALLGFVNEGDVVYVTDMSRLSRDALYTIKILDALNDKGVKVVCQ